MRYEESDEFKLLCARVDELFDRAAGDLAASRFLTPAEQYFTARRLAASGRSVRTLFFGGAPGAQRKKLFVLPDYLVALAEDGDLFDTARQFLGEDAFGDIQVLKLSGGGFRDFSHRDYLGSLLSLGIERAVLGDIAPIDDYSAYIFVDRRVAGFLLGSELRVANDRVKVARTALPAGYEIVRKFKPIADTVASARLDGVVAALCNLSREAAKEKILSKEVEQNYETAEKTDTPVSAGDVISVRGIGKFEVESVSDPTKKGRFRLIAKKYIYRISRKSKLFRPEEGVHSRLVPTGAANRAPRFSNREKASGRRGKRRRNTLCSALAPSKE